MPPTFYPPDLMYPPYSAPGFDLYMGRYPMGEEQELRMMEEELKMMEEERDAIQRDIDDLRKEIEKMKAGGE